MNKIRVLVINNRLYYKNHALFPPHLKKITSLNTEETNIYFYQQVRWRKTIPARKPIWLPPAKTKLFYIPKQKETMKEEHDEIIRLFCNYRTYMRAIHNYFKMECEEMSATGHLTLAKAKIEQEEFEKLLEENRKENERVAVLREARVAKELEAEHKRLLNLEEAHMEWLEKKKIELDSLVRREKELSKTYITLENLDEAIEKCLNEVVNYNFAIDLEGKVLWETSPHPTFSPYRENKKDIEENVFG